MMANVTPETPTPETPKLQTPRLLLRRWHKQDREPFHRMNADPHVMEFFPACLTPQESDGLIDRIEAHMERHGVGFYAVRRNRLAAWQRVLESRPGHGRRAGVLAARVRGTGTGRGSGDDRGRQCAVAQGDGKAGNDLPPRGYFRASARARRPRAAAARAVPDIE